MPWTTAALLALAPLAPADPDTKAVVAASNRFALELYGRLARQEGNLFFSPFSVSTALAMTSAGARGDTLSQMASALHLPGQEQLHSANAALLRQLNGWRRPYQLSVANALWGQKGSPFVPEFLRLQRERYGAPLREVHFADADRAARAINSWVNEQTRRKIHELVTPGHFGPATRLVLTNAIYFKSDWAAKFRRDETRPGPFLVSAAKQVKVPLMSQTTGKGVFRYHATETAKLLEMPYTGGELSLVVLLPAKPSGLGALERQLPGHLNDWLAGLRTVQRVKVTLPRFKVEDGRSLKEPLSDLGMPLAFDLARADFSGISDSTQRLALSDVVHKALVEVNEEGTEAAAATAATVTTLSAAKELEFRADRPFVFLIRDRRSGAVLFLGRLANPA